MGAQLQLHPRRGCTPCARAHGCASSSTRHVDGVLQAQAAGRWGGHGDGDLHRDREIARRLRSLAQNMSPWLCHNKASAQ